MKSMEEIYEELNAFIREGQWEKIESCLQTCMDEAREEEENGIYVAAGNELLSFYRQSGQYEKAFAVSEDILLLMEELNLEDTEHFALVLMSTGAAYEGAGQQREAERCYARAARILDGKKGMELLLAEALTSQGLLLLYRQEEKQAETFLNRARELFEQFEEKKEGEVSAAEEERAAGGQASVYYLTALSGLGEAAWKQGNYAQALSCYEKAAEKSFSLSGASEGTRLFWKNCAAVCTALKDPEKEAHYLALMDGNPPLHAAATQSQTGSEGKVS